MVLHSRSPLQIELGFGQKRISYFGKDFTLPLCRKSIQKIYTEMLSKKFMEMQEKLSGDTTSDESLNLDETLNVNDKSE